MDVQEALRTNLATREFLEKTVEREKILQIIEAGRLAHSSKNSQPCRFIIIEDRKRLKELAETTPSGKHLARCAFAIALLTENAKMPEVDGTRAMEDMMLTAWELGIGSCWVTNFEEQKVKKILKAPENWKLLTVVPFGYPLKAERKGIKERLPLDKIAFKEEYGKRL